MTLEDERRSNLERVVTLPGELATPRRAQQVMVTVVEVVALMNKEAGVAVVVPDDKQEQ